MRYQRSGPIVRLRQASVGWNRRSTVPFLALMVVLLVLTTGTGEVKADPSGVVGSSLSSSHETSRTSPGPSTQLRSRKVTGPGTTTSIERPGLDRNSEASTVGGTVLSTAPANMTAIGHNTSMAGMLVEELGNNEDDFDDDYVLPYAECVFHGHQWSGSPNYSLSGLKRAVALFEEMPHNGSSSSHTANSTVAATETGGSVDLRDCLKGGPDPITDALRAILIAPIPGSRPENNDTVGRGNRYNVAPYLLDLGETEKEIKVWQPRLNALRNLIFQQKSENCSLLVDKVKKGFADAWQRYLLPPRNVVSEKGTRKPPPIGFLVEFMAVQVTADLAVMVFSQHEWTSACLGSPADRKACDGKTLAADAAIERILAHLSSYLNTFQTDSDLGLQQGVHLIETDDSYYYVGEHQVDCNFDVGPNVDCKVSVSRQERCDDDASKSKARCLKERDDLVGNLHAEAERELKRYQDLSVELRKVLQELDRLLSSWMRDRAPTESVTGDTSRS